MIRFLLAALAAPFVLAAALVVGALFAAAAILWLAFAPLRWWVW